MYWSEAIKERMDAIKPIEVDATLLRRLLGLTDHTRLYAGDTESDIVTFFKKAQTDLGQVAAVCVYPQFVGLAASQFAGTSIKVSTVLNYPKGIFSLDKVLMEMEHVLDDGAQEVDIVFPWQRYLAGEQQYTQTFVAACKAACSETICLKIILETGALIEPALIADASWNAMTAGADFIKTSTGKEVPGATLEAATAILLAIHHALPQLKRNVGIKISGGVKTIAQATQYLALAENIMGQKWIDPTTFRIGSSTLVNEILKTAKLLTREIK